MEYEKWDERGMGLRGNMNDNGVANSKARFKFSGSKVRNRSESLLSTNVWKYRREIRSEESVDTLKGPLALALALASTRGGF